MGGFSAMSAEPTGTTIQFVGSGSNLLFYGSATRTRYYFSTGDIAVINEKDAEMFLKLKTNGKPLFNKVENVVSAIEAGEIMSDLETPKPTQTESTPEVSEEETEVVEDEPRGDEVDQTGYTEDSFEDTLPPFNEEELLPTGVDEDGNEEVTVRPARKSKKAKKNTSEEE
jgi:hypothetical protein